ncbi:MAG: magnesium-dependent phosphatase-1 [Candidatus Freyarchaeota archaeon]
MKTKLVVFDADDTLWNVSKRYASFLKPPLKPTGTDTLRDSEGSTVRLLPGVRKVLKELKERGILISIASLNSPEPNMVLECLKLFQLDHYFIHPQVNHKGKNRNIKTILKLLREKNGIQIDFPEVVFIDDQELNIKSVRKGCPGIKAIHLGTDIANITQILNLL